MDLRSFIQFIPWIFIHSYSSYHKSLYFYLYETEALKFWQPTTLQPFNVQGHKVCTALKALISLFLGFRVQQWKSIRRVFLKMSFYYINRLLLHIIPTALYPFWAPFKIFFAHIPLDIIVWLQLVSKAKSKAAFDKSSSINSNENSGGRWNVGFWSEK